MINFVEMNFIILYLEKLNYNLKTLTRSKVCYEVILLKNNKYENNWKKQLVKLVLEKKSFHECKTENNLKETKKLKDEVEASPVKTIDMSSESLQLEYN